MMCRTACVATWQQVQACRGSHRGLTDHQQKSAAQSKHPVCMVLNPATTLYYVHVTTDTGDSNLAVWYDVVKFYQKGYSFIH
jgi:hypothetical protein